MDERRVVSDREAKSLSRETIFLTDISDAEVLRVRLLELADQVARRLRRQKLQARSVHIKARFADFRTFTRSRTLACPTDVTPRIAVTAEALLTEGLPTASIGVRLLGVRLSGLAGHRPVQQTSFTEKADQRNLAQRRLDQVADAIRDRFGSAAIARASGLTHGLQLRPEHSPDRPEDLPQ